MEIISKIVTYTGFAPSIMFFVLFIICFAIAISKVDRLDKDSRDVIVILCSILFLASIFCLVIMPTKHERYRLRVNDSVTVKELSETYEIIEYDRDTDLWIVEKKEETDGH